MSFPATKTREGDLGGEVPVDVPDLWREREVAMLGFSIVAFLISLPLPVMMGFNNEQVLGYHLLVYGAVFPSWWANPLLVVGWVCGYYRRGLELNICSSIALGVGLLTLLLPERFSFEDGYYCWLASLIFATIAGLVIPTRDAWERLHEILVRWKWCAGNQGQNSNSPGMSCHGPTDANKSL